MAIEIEKVIYHNMIGKIIKEVRGGKIHSSDLLFIATDGSTFNFFPEDGGYGNDVSVRIDDIIGDVEDLIGYPVLIAESVTSQSTDTYGTWTFYKFATVKCYVTIKWFGTSNGYYSEAVSYQEVLTKNNVVSIFDYKKS